MTSSSGGSQPRSRVGAGVREGGQFAVEGRAEADVVLQAAPEVDAEDTVEAYSPRYVMSTSVREEAVKRIERANKRLARAGIDSRFEATWGEPYLTSITTPDGVKVKREMVDLELSTPSISYGGWEFVAALDQTGEDGDLIVRTRPGAELDGWRPDSATCDHCGKARTRATTYVVRNEDGQIKQVGSSCMQLFLGVKPSGLWTLDVDPLESSDEDDWMGGWAAGSPLGDAAEPRDIIRAALAATDGGRGYVSANAAGWGHGISTGDSVRMALGMSFIHKDQRDHVEEVTARMQQVSEDDIDSVLAYAAQQSGSDYAENMRLLAGHSHVTAKHTALLASAVSGWARDNERRVEREKRVADYVPGHMAPVGETVKGSSVTVTHVQYLDDPYSYTGGVNSLIIMRDEAGHEVKWFASGRHDVNAGQRLALTGGRVKKHDVYQERDQTILTRVKYTVVEQDESSSAA